MVVGLASDRPGAGKSTAAGHLISSHNFREHSIGATVKAEIDAMVATQGFRYEERHKEEFRDGLIWWTRFRIRRSAPDYWLTTITRAMQGADDRPLVFSDVRDPVEADQIRAAGGVLVAIRRDSVPRHPGWTEISMDDYDFDQIVDNSHDDGGSRMFTQLDSMVTAFGHGRLPVTPADRRRFPKDT